MLPANYQAVATILLAIVPGYIAIATWARARTRKGLQTDFQTIVESLAISAVIQVSMAPIAFVWLYPNRAHLDHHAGDVFIWLLATVFVLPVIGGVVVARAANYIYRHTKIFEPMTPSAWDSFFNDNTIPQSGFLLVEFNDGKRLAGGWGVGSYAITSPEPHGVVLAVEWVVDEDGYPVEPVPDSAGVLVPDASNIRRLSFLLPAHGEADAPNESVETDLSTENAGIVREENE